MTILVAGVSHLGGEGVDFGPAVVERLRQEPLDENVVLEDLAPGRAHVASRLEELRPHTLLLVGSAARGRPPGTVERRLVEPAAACAGPACDGDGALPSASLNASAAPSSASPAPPAGAQTPPPPTSSELPAVDRVLQLAFESGFRRPRTIVVEVEPVSEVASETLSPEAADALEEALELIRADIRRAALLDLASQLRDVMASDPLERTPVVESVEALLTELAALEREGRWGRTFAERDRLRLRISTGEHAGDAVGGLHWAMWWALIEELDRLQALEATLGLD